GTAPVQRPCATPEAIQPQTAPQNHAAARRDAPSLPETAQYQQQRRIDPRSIGFALTWYRHSLGIVKDHADGMAVAGADPADAMAQINAIEPARPLHRATMHSKCHRIALREGHHFRPRL